MASQATFMRTQYAFAAHIRNPEIHPRPNDVEARRMKIYNELFYNNIEDFMSSSYPVLRQIHDDASWHRLIRHYFQHHRAKTPLFPEMPREFLTYLQNEYQPGAGDFPFMLELAHYEWAELALSLSEQEADWTASHANTDILNGLPQLSPLAWPLSYHWPVHRIGPDYLPDSPPASMTYLLLYRDKQDDVHFMELNPVTARLLQLMTEQSLHSTEAMLRQIAEELAHPEPEVVIQGGMTILHDLLQRHVISIVNKN